MIEEPLVTVNILSYNRKDELRNTLTIEYEQDYKNIEVIVVDNSSSDGSPEMVEEEFPDVKLIKLDENIGIAGWNKGFEIANGEYVLVLDDDSYPLTNTIKKALNCLNQNETIGVVCLPVYNKRLNKYETETINKKKPKTFIGCGALIRKSIFEKVGYYNELLFLYEHEIEFSMRVYNCSFIIQYGVDADVIHENSLLNRKIVKRKDLRRKFYTSRNIIVVLYLHFPFYIIFTVASMVIFARIIASLFDRTFFVTIKGFFYSLILLPRINKSRIILNKNIQGFYHFGKYMKRFELESMYE